MSKFALEEIEINGRQTIDKLLINEKCPFDEFEKEVIKRKRYLSELEMIYSYLEYISDGKILPATKFKDITPDNESVKEYELKSKHLRVYAIKKKDGKIIILGGYKNNQKRDIRRFRSIKKRYLEFLKPKKK